MIYRISLSIAFLFSVSISDAQFSAVPDTTLYAQLKDQLGKNIAGSLLNSYYFYSLIKENANYRNGKNKFFPQEGIILKGTPVYESIFNPDGKSRDVWIDKDTIRIRNIKRELEDVLVLLYDSLRQRDIIRYANPYLQERYVKLYDHCANRIGKIYPPTHRQDTILNNDEIISLTVLTDVNQVVNVKIGRYWWVERTLEFSEMSYNVVETKTIPGNANDGLANHKQITSVNLYYNEDRQLGVDISISLENGQRLLDTHYAGGFGNEKTRRRYRKEKEKNPPGTDNKYPPCFCDGQDYCPITHLVNKYEIYGGGGTNNLFEHWYGYGWPSIPELHRIHDCLDFKAANVSNVFDPYLKIGDVELVQRGWHQVWFPDGSLYARKYYAAPFFEEQGEYGNSVLAGMEYAPEKVNKTGDTERTATRKNLWLVGEKVLEGTASGYMTEHDHQKNGQWERETIFHYEDGRVDTLTAPIDIEKETWLAALRYLTTYEPGILWPVKLSRYRSEALQLYHLKEPPLPFVFPLQIHKE